MIGGPLLFTDIYWPVADIVLILDKTCPEPTVIPNAQQTYDTSVQGSFAYRSSVTYTCDVGYIFNDRIHSKSLVCGQDNQWTGDIDMCEGMNVFFTYFFKLNFIFLNKM